MKKRDGLLCSGWKGGVEKRRDEENAQLILSHPLQLCVFSGPSVPRGKKKQKNRGRCFFERSHLQGQTFSLLAWVAVERRHAINHYQNKRGSGEFQRAVYVFTPLFTASTQKHEFVLSRAVAQTLCWTFVVRGRHQVAFTDLRRGISEARVPSVTSQGADVSTWSIPAHILV